MPSNGYLARPEIVLAGSNPAALTPFPTPNNNYSGESLTGQSRCYGAPPVAVRRDGGITCTAVLETIKTIASASWVRWCGDNLHMIETQSQQFPAVVAVCVSPRGLGWTGNKPLMRNLSAEQTYDSHPSRNTAGNNFGKPNKER